MDLGFFSGRISLCYELFGIFNNKMSECLINVWMSDSMKIKIKANFRDYSVLWFNQEGLKKQVFILFLRYLTNFLLSFLQQKASIKDKMTRPSKSKSKSKKNRNQSKTNSTTTQSENSSNCSTPETIPDQYAWDWQSTKSELRERFEYIFQNSLFCDAHFIVGQDTNRQTISAHKLVLAASSVVFLTMFSEKWSTDRPEITVPDVDPTAFKQMLQ